MLRAHRVAVALVVLFAAAPAGAVTGGRAARARPSPAGATPAPPRPADVHAALDRAKAAADAGKTDDVVFALQHLGHLTGADATRAGAILTEASSRAFATGDVIMALQLCQMALRQTPDDANALVACIEAARTLKRFDPAEAYTARLVRTHPADPRGPLYEARIMLSEGEWQKARDAADTLVAEKNADPAWRDEARHIRARADKELHEREVGLSEVRHLAARLKRARARARSLASAGTTPAAAAAGSHDEVVIYTTPWCGYCKAAKRWMRAHGVAFEERDVQNDQSAIQELAEKAEAAHVVPRGVPVIDVDGQLILGWSAPALERALRRHHMLPGG